MFNSVKKDLQVRITKKKVFSCELVLFIDENKVQQWKLKIKLAEIQV